MKAFNFLTLNNTTMKTFTLIISIAICNFAVAQEIIYREDKNVAISILTSSVPVQLEPNFCSAGAGALIPKDTSIRPMFMLTFHYDAPVETKSDSTDAIDIILADGKTYHFQKYQDDQKVTEKDSSVFFGALIDYECMQQMKISLVTEIVFITNAYRHSILIQDKHKLFLPNLSRYIIDQAKEEHNSVVK